ncbi:hypothetical protein KC678_01430 [Candidatus Dojkabacteria bacterium]|uniref:Uncharacterized protein n=1 Tax=Candidatus Dojkabacteria bacterium TaxID=2099670 RepID=A0A955IAJ9_9BACT|nr:hypothetical protein [Candidatus Dojkabacteria bacterium]
MSNKIKVIPALFGIVILIVVFAFLNKQKTEPEVSSEPQSELFDKVYNALSPFEEKYVKITNDFNAAVQIDSSNRESALEQIQTELIDLEETNQTLLDTLPEFEELAKTDTEKEFYKEVYTLAQIYEKQLTKDWPTLIQIESSSEVEGLSADGLNYARQMESERELQVQKLFSLKDQL